MSSESLLAAVERQFVDITHRQHVAAIKLTLATFIREAITILRRTEIRLRICNSMRISVIGTDHGIPAEVLLHTHLERMETGVKTRGKHINRVITQKRPDRVQQRSPGGIDWGGDACRDVGQGKRFIDVDESDEVSALIADITDLHGKLRQIGRAS